MSSLHSFCIELLIVYGFCIATWALFRTLFVLNRNKIKKNHVDGDCDSNKKDAAATNVYSMTDADVAGIMSGYKLQDGTAVTTVALIFP